MGTINKLISIIIPTRLRVHLIEKALTSIAETVNIKDRIEVLVRFDDDDMESVGKFQKLKVLEQLDVRVFVGPRHRYLHLNEYHNELCKHSTGEFIFAIADDCIIKTMHWDDLIEVWSGQTIVLRSNVQGVNSNVINACPILSRKVYDILGHFSPTAHSDNYIRAYGKATGIERPVDILIEHFWPEEDAVMRDRDADVKISSPDYNGAVVQGELQKDILLLRENLK